MGFLLGLIGYLTAVALMISGAVASAMWVTRPLPPPPSEKALTVTASAKQMQGANVALTKSAKKKAKQRVSKRR
jgi:hypothetical protein